MTFGYVMKDGFNTYVLKIKNQRLKVIWMRCNWFKKEIRFQKLYINGINYFRVKKVDSVFA